MNAAFECAVVKFGFEAGSIEKTLIKDQNTECDYLVLIDIYKENINELAQAFQKISPINFRAKSIAFVIDDKNGETNAMNVKTIIDIVNLQNTFGPDAEKPCKDYYIKNNLLGGSILIARQDGQMMVPPGLKTVLDAL